MDNKEVSIIQTLMEVSALTENEVKLIIKFAKETNYISDSDVDDFCQENHISVRKTERVLFALSYPETDCIKCKNNGFAFDMHPCTCCSRNPNTKDLFEPFK